MKLVSNSPLESVMIVGGTDFVNAKPDGTNLISASVITYCLSVVVNFPETNILAVGFPDGSCSVVYYVESSEFNIKRVEVGDVEVAELGELNVGGIVKKNFVDASHTPYLALIV